MSSRDSTRRVVSCALILLAVLVVLSLATPAAFHSAPLAAPQDTSRKIVSDDFTKNRKQAPSVEVRSKAASEKASSNTPSKPKERRTYKLAASSQSRTKPNSRPTAVAQLGITIWKLRPPKAGDTGARLLVREKEKSSQWVPERVAADTTFREGDHVRLSIESPRAGYLYVIDRDLLKNGKTGDAMLIYPWIDMLSGDNQVSPGQLVDIPAQEDNPSYFTARLTSPDQVGEILTLIVTSSPLELPISDKPFQIPSAEVLKWEKMWGVGSERFEMEGGAGEAWTKQEQQAATRSGTRQLTREDPAPQTIYRVLKRDKAAFLLNVQLRYAK